MVVRGSRFLAIAVPVADRREAEEFVATERRAHLNPTHVVPAFLLRDGTALSSDAGEPSGSAGAPLLAVLAGAGLHDVACVVVRWYGGTKLGVGGLQRAYAAALSAALEGAPLARRELARRVEVRYGHELTSPVLRALETAGARDLDHAYDQAVTTRASVPTDRVGALRATLRDATRGSVELVDVGEALIDG